MQVAIVFNRPCSELDATLPDAFHLRVNGIGYVCEDPPTENDAYAWIAIMVQDEVLAEPDLFSYDGGDPNVTWRNPLGPFIPGEPIPGFASTKIVNGWYL